MTIASLYDAFAEASADTPDLDFLATTPSCGGAVLTYGEADARVEALSARYRARGWGPGHRIALNLGSQPLHFLHFLALNRLGASIVPMNPDHRAAEIRYQLGHARADLVVATAAAAAIVGPALAPGGPPVVLADDTDLPQAPPAPRTNPPGLQAEALILYTSGTSGAPKGCVLTNEYVLTVGRWYRDLGGLFTMRRGEERILNPLPAFHMNCGVTSVTTAILTRNCLILPDRFHASTWWQDVAGSRATAIHYLGIMPPALLKQPPGAWDRAHRVRFGLGAGCDPTLHAAFEARFGLPLVEVWGMTETGRFLANNFEPRQTDTRAFGRQSGELEAMVAADDGRPVPDGTPGELLVRCAGPDPRRGFFRGYLDNPEATAEAWRGGWFHTGDVVRRDQTGMFYFVDRRKDMIRRSGENISASEVEAVLAAHPAVARVAVLAVSDEMRDEEVMACVVPAPGTAGTAETAAALVAHALAELAYYKAPGWIAFRDDLPVTSTNKIQKNRIFEGQGDPRERAIDCRDLKKRKLAS